MAELLAKAGTSVAEPEPIETVALLPDPPVTFTWRGVRRVTPDGPERVFGSGGARRRADLGEGFFRSRTSRRRFWIYRGDGGHEEVGSHRWFLHGIFG
jgi:protein ImuB